MNAQRPVTIWHAATLVFAAGLATSFPNKAQAQHTPDPYNIVGEYNNQYEPYMFATNPSMPGTLPNQAALNGRSGSRNANNFQRYLEDDEAPNDLPRSSITHQSGPGTPYYRAYRQFDDDFQRTYRPNELADKSYYSGQQKLNEKYFQALRETDPRKRAQLLREYNLENVRAARELSTGRGGLDRDREASRDRFNPGAEGDDPDRPTARRPATSAPLSRRPSSGPAPVPSPATRGRTGSSLPNSSRAPSRTGAAPGASSSLSPSTVLERSERLDRATRATAPSVAPSTTAPAPR